MDNFDEKTERKSVKKIDPENHRAFAAILWWGLFGLVLFSAVVWAWWL